MRNLFLISTMILLGTGPLRAQDRLTVPFRDGSMPRQLVVDGMVGSIEITGYNGQEAIVESTGGRPAARKNAKETPIPAGMRRIGGASVGLNVTEENNVVHVSTGPWVGRADLKIQVPTQTSVRVNTITGQQIRIENVNGEIEVQSGHGDVNVLNVSGSVVANSMNGKVTVSMNAVSPGKPMSFSSMSGDIDVTLPAALKANLKMKTEQGDIFTDFDAQVTPQTSTTTKSEEKTKNGSKSVVRWRVDRTTDATINGGGQEIQFTSFRGNILIHKK